VRISGEEVRLFCRDQGLRLLALEGLQTQYMWTTWRKPPTNAVPPLPANMAIRRITNAFSSEPVAPASGRFASVSAWVEGLPADADLNTLVLEVGTLPAVLTYLGREDADGLQQLNALLPAGLPTGLVPVTLRHSAGSPSPQRQFRIIPPPPPVPRILAVSDGVDLLSGHRIWNRSAKLHVEEMQAIEKLEATVGGRPVQDLDFFCTDPMPPRHEVNFQLPPAAELPPGVYPLELRLGSRRFAPVMLELVR
jgi:hypothetical protein